MVPNLGRLANKGENAPTAGVEVDEEGGVDANLRQFLLVSNEWNGEDEQAQESTVDLQTQRLITELVKLARFLVGTPAPASFALGLLPLAPATIAGFRAGASPQPLRFHRFFQQLALGQAALGKSHDVVHLLLRRGGSQICGSRCHDPAHTIVHTTTPGTAQSNDECACEGP